jgi:hypothetical protein
VEHRRQEAGQDTATATAAATDIATTTKTTALRVSRAVGNGCSPHPKAGEQTVAEIFVGQKCKVASYGFGHVVAIRPNDPGLPGMHVLVEFNAGSRHEPSWFLSTINIEFYDK